MTLRQINMLKAVSPYMNPHIRPHILTLLSFFELINNASGINLPLSNIFSSNEPLITDKDSMVETLKNMASPDERTQIDNMMMMIQMINLMNMMNDINNETGSGAPRSDKNPDHAFELLKSFVPQESTETFNMIKMFMENVND